MKDKDCMTDIYTYDELVNAYDNFLVPAVAFYIGKETDNVITSMGIAIESVQVSLFIDEAASLTFEIVNAYNLTTHSIREDIKDTFALGAIISVALGYGSNLTPIFKGYITEYQTKYQDVPVVSVTAIDFRKLLMKNKRIKYQYKEKTYTKIFESIIENYTGLYDSMHVDQVQDKENLIQNQTDYEFIQEELSPKANREFYVVGGKVYFKEPEKTGTCFLELEWGKNILSFQKSLSYCKEKIKAYSAQNDKTGSVESADVQTTQDSPSLTTEEIVDEYELRTGMDKAALENWIQKKIEDKKKENERINGSVLGLPEIVPGRYIQIKGVDSEDEGIYYIKTVTHSFGSSGFQTNFTIGVKAESWTPSKDSIKKQMKTNCNGVMRAVVKQNWNAEKPGMVLVEFLTGEEGKNSSDWLPVIQPYCGNGYGFYFLPEVGTEVIIGSEMGDVNSLMVLGAAWNQVDTLPTNIANENNTIKCIQTKGKHEILFCDVADKGSIQINTAGKLHITLDDEEKKISIVDDAKKNGIIIDTNQEEVQILSGKKITMKAGNKEMLVLNAESDSILLNAGKIEEKADQSYQLKSGKMVADANITEIKGTSIKLNGSGITEIKGSMVKIN